MNLDESILILGSICIHNSEYFSRPLIEVNINDSELSN